MKNWLLHGAALALLLTASASAQVGPLNNPTSVAGGSGTAADGTAFVVESVPGTAATASGTDDIAVGDGAVANATAHGIAIGVNADATGENCVAIGGDGTDDSSADCSGTQSVAIGFNTLADADATVAVGDNADAGGASAIAVGETANASGADAISAGADSIASNTNSIAIGNNADSTGVNSIAIGGNATDAASADAVDTNAIAIGVGANGDANSAIGIGDGAQATGTNTVALGNGPTASAANSISIGNVSTASTATDTIAIGATTDATGANCIAIGGNVTDTDSADCSAADAVALGQHILADDVGEFAFASGEFAAQSDAHTSIYVLRNATTDATQTEIFADGSAGDISIASDCSASFRINIVARRTDADDESAGYLITGVIDNNAGTTALVGSVTTTTVGEDTAAWDVTATADDTNDGLNVLVTGEAAKTIRWVGRAEVAYVCG